MSVLCALLGYVLASAVVDVPRLVISLAAVGLLVAAANALNCWLESDVDALMQRTEGRPLPSGRLPRDHALGFGICCAITATYALFRLNPLTGYLGGASLLSYVALYTPLKRRSAHALWVGAVPGAMPPVLGWTAASGSLEWPAVALFAWMFCWQVPHFIAISIFREGEYARAGLKTLVHDVGAATSRWLAAAFSLFTVAASLAFLRLDLGGLWLAFAAGAGGLALVAGQVVGLWPRFSERLARPNFLYSLLYLTLVLGALGLERALPDASPATGVELGRVALN